MFNSSNKLLIYLGMVTKVITVSDIKFIKADGAYSSIYFLDDKKPLVVSKSLKKLEDILKLKGFCRCHRSFIVNLNLIVEISNGKDKYVVLKTGDELVLSQRGKARLMSYLQ